MLDLYQRHSHKDIKIVIGIGFAIAIAIAVGLNQWKQEVRLRLFMVPGMQHCGGGPGPNQFDKMAVMERWRESGIAPDQILAVHVSGSSVDMTRPLCPYPKVAAYRGSGSTNDAANSSCKVVD